MVREFESLVWFVRIIDGNLFATINAPETHPRTAVEASLSNFTYRLAAAKDGSGTTEL